MFERTEIIKKQWNLRERFFFPFFPKVAYIHLQTLIWLRYSVQHSFVSLLTHFTEEKEEKTKIFFFSLFRSRLIKFCYFLWDTKSFFFLLFPYLLEEFLLFKVYASKMLIANIWKIVVQWTLLNVITFEPDIMITLIGKKQLPFINLVMHRKWDLWKVITISSW